MRAEHSADVVVHGDQLASDALRARIEHELGLSARVPEHGETVDLGG